tara:strand:- start:44 stop:343 length:300 start_codon:yes stop_codon:yes gene_type:complete
MANKTKTILRNDPAKKRIAECQECGHELDVDPVSFEPVADDMLEFINQQEHWGKHNPPSICWGMLSAVFFVLFEIAPSKEDAIQLITDCMAHYIEGGDA